MAYVAYHNADQMGGPLEDGPPFGMLSRKSAKHLEGQIVWVVEGSGKKKRYTLRHRYRVDAVEEIEDEYFRFEFYGEAGLNLQPGIEIPAEDWRKDFLKSVGIFGIGVAQLQPEYELQFNALAGVDPTIDDNKDDFEYTEGEIRETIRSYRSRSPDARTACIAEHGFLCLICGFDFAKMYGDTCKDFIEVHHIQPLSETQGPQLVNPKDDLIPICPNCHRAIHLLECTVAELKDLVDQSRAG